MLLTRGRGPHHLFETVSRFEWQHEKTRSYIQKHSIDFQVAVRIFRQDVVSRTEIVAGEERTVRIDPEVLAFFKDQGPRCQTRINAVLRVHMKRERARAKRRGRES